MTQTEYEQKRRECWRIYAGAFDIKDEIPNEAFKWVFDRAYALGKVKGTITQEEIEDAAKKYAAEVDKNVRDLYGIEEQPASLTFGECAAESFREGANFALGKQEKDADTVISGWVCRDKVRNEPFTSDLFIVLEKPTRVEEWGKWCNCGDYIELDSNLFPDLTWDDRPEPVEIIIKRKKK